MNAGAKWSQRVAGGMNFQVAKGHVPNHASQVVEGKVGLGKVFVAHGLLWVQQARNTRTDGRALDHHHPKLLAVGKESGKVAYASARL